MTVKTRFAPSPTGYLHIGGARTALYSWLVARKQGGKFVLRIEDTDRERSTQEAVDVILDAMTWLGLDYDEGPFFQTERMARYREIIDQLLEQGDAYHCYCSREALDHMREQAMANKQKPRYDGRCRERTEPVPGVNPVVRFKNPLVGDVVIDDLVRGRVVISNSELDDLIIARSDGMPTYNLSVVVDDMDMQMTHVLRGDDHLNNTPRQINILHALDAPQPVYGHVPMILGGDGKRLSKRHGAVNVLQYRDQGYLPHALLNYLVRLGWSHGDQELFTIDEMIQLFDMSDVNHSASTFDGDKLLWLNHQTIINSPAEELLTPLMPHLAEAGIVVDEGPDLTAVVSIQKERCKTLVELAAACRLFYGELGEYNPKAAKKGFKGEAESILIELQSRLQSLDGSNWNAASLHDLLQQAVDDLGVGFGQVGQPLRVAITGGAPAPGLDITMELLGKPCVVERVGRALKWLADKRLGE
ncbi:MAG: glutamate--tRNA ligase [Gammaproteobacteria bacterium]|nr:MAG: glutamate--tRNA ligase [Gammaproteobacteria bacterium]RLA15637.1 MAG: glutamate--tRNA ligase [Gammaproteobacteria bacterium]